MRRYSVCLAVVMSILLVAGCTSVLGAGGGTLTPGSTPSTATPQPRTALPTSDTTVVDGTSAAELALGISRALFRHAPAVVLVGASDDTDLAQAMSSAVDIGVPLLLTPESDSPGATAQLRAELTRLAPQTIITVGRQAKGWAQTASAGPTNDTVTTVADAADGVVTLPDVVPAEPLHDLLVLALDRPASKAATSTARASGARVLLVDQPDPRTDDDVIAALSGQPTSHVLALGSAFGPADQLRRRIDTAATGTLLPGGRQVLFPGRRMIALYGHPGDAELGSLGEQSLKGAIARAKRVAASYQALVDDTVVPAFEIIATVASSSPGSDGDYSSESSIAHLRPWVDAARDAGVYVVLDLQPGRTDFLTQAKRYTELLVQPHVGLALDPEWRLKPDQRHLEQIGSVSASEINKTIVWLADLTRDHKLPQKLLMLHQFRLDMIKDRSTVDTSHDELRVVIHADGFGTAGQKFDTWNTLHIKPPSDVWWGWKNFYDEDKPTFTPKRTVAVKPSPVFVSYQ